jgi:hypothetical protein
VNQRKKIQKMQNTHNGQNLISVKTDSNADTARGPADEYPMPDPLEVAKLLGNKEDRNRSQFRQGLMRKILDGAPQMPMKRSRAALRA